MFNSSSSREDISKILRQYTDDVKNASMVINKYLHKGEFIVFDLRCNPSKNGRKLLYKFGKKNFFLLNALTRDPVIGF